MRENGESGRTRASQILRENVEDGINLLDQLNTVEVNATKSAVKFANGVLDGGVPVGGLTTSTSTPEEIAEDREKGFVRLKDPVQFDEEALQNGIVKLNK